VPWHPRVRLVCFLVLAAALAAGGPAQLALGLAAALLPWLTPGARALRRRGRRALWRLRWLLLSVAVLYLGMTPGDPLWTDAPAWLPSREGLALGLERAAVLALLALAAVWVLEGGREGLVGALGWLTRPLARLGLPAERLALRLVLTLEEVEGGGLREQAAARLPRHAPAPSRRGWRAWGERAADCLAEAVRRGETAPLEPVALHAVPPPPRQWLLPGALAALLAAPALLPPLAG